MIQRPVGIGVMAAVAVALVFSEAARSQDAIKDAQNKLLARRAAEADCFRKLAETVYGLKINSDTYVRDFVTESDQIRTAVDSYVKGIRLGEPRYYDDGVCEVDAEVTVAKLVTKLKEIHKAHYEGDVVKSEDFEHFQEQLKKDVIRVTGSGAPRPELPPDLPEGIEEVITSLPQDYQPLQSNIPPIWRSVGPQGRLSAERAAQVDAMRRLLEQIKGLRVTSDTLVRDFVSESDAVSTSADGFVVGASEVGKYLHHDELIAEVTVEIPLERLVTRIKEFHSQHYHGNKVTTRDITNIQKRVERKTVRATGSGVPNPRFLRRAVQSGAVTIPEWMGEIIRVMGEGTDPEMDSAQGKLRATRAARLDGLRKLAEQIYGLEVSSATRVQDFVTQYDEIVAQMDAVISGAVVSQPTIEDGVTRVTVSLPAVEVWSVINDYQRMLARHGN